MRTVFDQRRDNLRELAHTWGGPTSLAKKLGHTNGSYLAQLAGPHPTREISEKVAREMERKLGLPLGWLDQVHAEGSRQIDDAALSACVRAVSTVLREQGHKAMPDQVAELTMLAYEHAKLTGRVDETYIKRIVRLVR